VLIYLAFLSFRTYVLNDSVHTCYAASLYCCVLSINDDDEYSIFTFFLFVLFCVSARGKHMLLFDYDDDDAALMRE